MSEAHSNSRRKPIPIGTRVGRLTVIGEAESNPKRHDRGAMYTVPCRCDCGTVLSVFETNIRTGHSQSCGCLKSERTREAKTIHGGAKTRLFRTWLGMKKRCTNPKDPKYAAYGARGITVCPEWSEFAAFQQWALASGYTDDLTIERKDNDKGYSPDNCTWLTMQRQSRNKQDTIWVSAYGEKKTLKDWAEDSRCLVGYHTLWNRVKAGWPFEDAMTRAANHRALSNRTET